MSWTCLILLFLSFLAQAQTPIQPRARGYSRPPVRRVIRRPVKRKSFFSDLNTSLIGEVGLSGGYFVPSESKLNPGNRILENPNEDALLDLRSELKLEKTSQKLVIRPRWTGYSKYIRYTDADENATKSKGHLDLTDAYYEWSPLSNLQLTGGLFVDGWGPAEFVNPSNPFFHLNFQNKSFFYKEKGHVLAKAVWNPTAKTTVALISEPASNNEAPFRYGEDFKPQWALRGEWQSDDVSQLLGILGGQELGGRDFVGEYMQFRSDKTGFSAYVEARHTKDPQRFQIESQGAFRELILRTQEGVKTYSVTGLRWEGRVDARLEWIYYELGYSEPEWDQLVQSVTQLSPFLANNADRFSRPGLEFFTKNWWSLSIRVPDLGPWNDWQWTNRLLLSTGDQAFGNSRGGLFQSDLEMPAFQAWTFFVEAQNYFGVADTELLLNSKQAYYLGVRWAW